MIPFLIFIYFKLSGEKMMVAADTDNIMELQSPGMPWTKVG